MRFQQYWKDPPPIVFIPQGIMTEVILVQNSNAPVGMIPSDNTKEVMLKSEANDGIRGRFAGEG